MTTAAPQMSAANFQIEAATLGEAVAAMTRAFAAASLETPALDARRLTEHVLGYDAVALVRDAGTVLDASARAQLGAAARRRLAREPVSRIACQRHFFGLELSITRATLDPRPETETLVEAALELANAGLLPAGGRPRVLDLGTGSGAILVALLSRLGGAHGVGVDLSAEALACARANLERHGLGERAALRHGDWLGDLAGPFDLVVSNPPYIATGEIAGLEPEVRAHDPRLALDGGADGLAAYRQLAPAVGRVLAPGGWCLLEVGAGQSESVLQLLAAAGHGAGAGQMRVWRDLGGIERCVAVRAQTA